VNVPRAVEVPLPDHSWWRSLPAGTRPEGIVAASSLRCLYDKITSNVGNTRQRYYDEHGRLYMTIPQEHYTVEQIAFAAHAASAGYCLGIGDPVPQMWDRMPEQERAIVTSGVALLIAHPEWNEGDSHRNWCAAKIEAGWCYGAAKDAVNKFHPDLVPYEQLGASQKTKDAIFLAIVRGLAGQVRTNIVDIASA